MTSLPRPFVIALLIVAIVSLPAFAGGDADAGRAFFNQKCGGCHALSPDTNHYAPNLNCIIGRAAGSAPFSAYTPDMKALEASGLIWDHQNLDAFLTDPKIFARERLQKPDATILMQVDVAEAAERRNVIAYIESRCR